MAFYIMYKWLSKSNTHSSWTMKDCKMEYERFLGKAENRMYYPNIDEMDKFASMWCKMVPDVSNSDNFFNGQENSQEIFNI